jgi:hypothetical protein
MSESDDRETKPFKFTTGMSLLPTLSPNVSPLEPMALLTDCKSRKKLILKLLMTLANLFDLL